MGDSSTSDQSALDWARDGEAIQSGHVTFDDLSEGLRTWIDKTLDLNDNPHLVTSALNRVMLERQATRRVSLDSLPPPVDDPASLLRYQLAAANAALRKKYGRRPKPVSQQVLADAAAMNRSHLIERAGVLGVDLKPYCLLIGRPPPDR